MPFRGPSRGIDTSVLLTPYNLQREQEQTAFDRAMQQAEMAQRASRSMGGSWNRIQDDNRANEAGQARLAMTPGVREGGAASRWGMSVADSPALQPRSFNQYGKSYSYDPAMDATAQGEGEAVKQSTAEQTRVAALARVPGISSSMASRMVYGRSGVLDPEGNASEMRQRIAEYIQNPSREAAARAIQAGANLNQFPDRFARVQQDPQGGELPIRPEAPIEGTPEWYDMKRKLGTIETDQYQREADIRARAAAVSPAVDRTERRMAENDVNARRREMQTTLRVRPRQSQYQTETRQPDKPAFDLAMQNFRADSTATAEAVRAAQEHLRALTGEGPLETAPAAGPTATQEPQKEAPAAATGRPSDASWLEDWYNDRLPERARAQYREKSAELSESPAAAPASSATAGAPEGNPEEAALALDMQDAVRRIMASRSPDAEKRRLVEAVNARARGELSKMRNPLMAEAIARVKALGLSKEQARAQLRAEGYEVP